MKVWLAYDIPHDELRIVWLNHEPKEEWVQLWAERNTRSIFFTADLVES